MLRIRVEEKLKATTLYVEGKLAGESVDELCRVWTSKRNEAPEKEMVVDLSSVRSVDSAGRKLLTQNAWVGNASERQRPLYQPIDRRNHQCRILFSF